MEILLIEGVDIIDFGRLFLAATDTKIGRRETDWYITIQD